MAVLDADKVIASLRGAFAREVGRVELLRTAAEKIRGGAASRRETPGRYTWIPESVDLRSRESHA